MVAWPHERVVIPAATAAVRHGHGRRRHRQARRGALLDFLIVGIPAGIVIAIIFGSPGSPLSLSYWLTSIITFAYFFLMESRDALRVPLLAHRLRHRYLQGR